MTWRLEAAHGALALAGRLMRVLRPIVQSPMATMLHAWHDLLLGGFVAAELVGNQRPRDVLTALEQFAEELLSGALVAAALHQDIEHVPCLIDGASQVVGFAIDGQEYFIQKPLVAWSGSSPSELIGVGLTELPRPLAHRFVGHDDATFSSNSSTSR